MMVTLAENSQLIQLAATAIECLILIVVVSVVIGIKKELVDLLHKQQDVVPHLLAAVPPATVRPLPPIHADLEPMPHAVTGKKDRPGTFTMEVTGDQNADLSAMASKYLNG